MLEYLLSAAAPVNFTNAPNGLATSLQMPLLAAQLFLSAFFIFVFTVVPAMFTKNVVIPIMTGSITMFFLIALGWIPPFVTLVIILLVVLLLSGRAIEAITGRGGGGSQ